MWELTKTFRFEASHRLPHHDGNCARLHGHSWSLTVCLSGHTLRSSGPKAGMLVDYGAIKAAASPLLAELDHAHLNDVLDNPTSERVAKLCFDRLRSRLAAPGLLAWVEIGETCTTACRYHGRHHEGVNMATEDAIYGPARGGIEAHAVDYKSRAWEAYTLAELGQWVHLLATRSGHRDNPEKRAKDLYDARNYLDMMKQKLDAIEGSE